MKKTIEGEVMSIKMPKTVVIRVERKFKHPFYRKIITRHKNYKVHNDNLELKVGDRVKAESTRPISKEKHFILVKKLNS